MSSIGVAEEAWLGLALLHYEHPTRLAFSKRQILERAAQEKLTAEQRPGVSAHVSLHNIANLPANPVRHRLFFKVGRNEYRLYRPGDRAHASRTGKTHPGKGDLPAQYSYLVDWFESDWISTAVPGQDDPILQLRGIGKHLWAGIDAVEYQRSVREERQQAR